MCSVFAIDRLDAIPVYESTQQWEGELTIGRHGYGAIFGMGLITWCTCLVSVCDAAIDRDSALVLAYRSLGVDPGAKAADLPSLSSAVKTIALGESWSRILDTEMTVDSAFSVSVDGVIVDRPEWTYDKALARRPRRGQVVIDKQTGRVLVASIVMDSALTGSSEPAIDMEDYLSCLQEDSFKINLQTERHMSAIDVVLAGGPITTRSCVQVMVSFVTIELPSHGRLDGWLVMGYKPPKTWSRRELGMTEPGSMVLAPCLYTLYDDDTGKWLYTSSCPTFLMTKLKLKWQARREEQRTPKERK